MGVTLRNKWSPIFFCGNSIFRGTVNTEWYTVICLPKVLSEKNALTGGSNKCISASIDYKREYFGK